MEISKSTRHSKIAGDFGEALVLYWLSKHGFECAKVDHTGIDIIARNPETNELMGIFVKSRTRNSGKEQDNVSIGNDNFTKIEAVCKAFECNPYFAIVVDAADTIRVFLLSADRLCELRPMGKRVSSWPMRDKDIDKYACDPTIKSFSFRSDIGHWW
jgi:Holliday junction resolvase-like predicted endonuclease